jgi:redox-sensitive bicupin YhaK (pirin superfamily)
MNEQTILSVNPLGFPWKTLDPFLFCVYHADAYPAGNDHMGPAAPLTGRSIGNDFTLKDGWRMYHGETVPGFPAHPHRGFETVTIATKGLIDHSDSLGAAARFGNGDVQWMTAGGGVQHSEMFPLLNREKGNPMELFQIWLNLPRAKKGSPAYFSMLWSETIPRLEFTGPDGRTTRIDLIAGTLAGKRAPTPPPDSWASDPSAHVRILTGHMQAGAVWTLPAGHAGLSSVLYFFSGEVLCVAGKEIKPDHSVEFRSNADLDLVNGNSESRFLLLQGRPIGEPVVQYGPFVTNTQAEIQQAFADYQRTQFGGWPWPRHDHVHPRERGRFARHANGVEEVR